MIRLSNTKISPNFSSLFMDTPQNLKSYKNTSIFKVIHVIQLYKKFEKISEIYKKNCIIFPDLEFVICF